MRIRLAHAGDAQGIQAIYGPIVQSTAISFELDPPTVDEMAARIEDRRPMLPWLVAEDGEAISGYAYAGRFSARPAYDWSVEASVYVAERAQGRRVGSALYMALFALLDTQGYRQVMAGIALPNDASVRLHERMGFALVGVYRDVGWKFGRWHDVGWWQRPLGAADSSPARLTALKDVPDPFVQAALEQGMQHLRTAPS
jgi:phosphinothricin acetyltransferase